MKWIRQMPIVFVKYKILIKWYLYLQVLKYKMILNQMYIPKMRVLKIGKGEYHTNVQLLNLIFTSIITGNEPISIKILLRIPVINIITHSIDNFTISFLFYLMCAITFHNIWNIRRELLYQTQRISGPLHRKPTM
jgi:hypothetical protein